jgi:RNA polymerase sigma-70 factor (ECF subfamily)
VSTPAHPTGERPTYEQAYAEHRAPLTQYTTQLAARYRLPAPHHDAQDIVQATFEDALKRWSTVDDPAGWLRTVAHRKVLKAAYDAARHRLATNDDFDRAGARNWTSVAPRASAEDTILTGQVFDAIADLPDRQRTVTYLRHVEGWSVREIAELLGCADGTVWAHTNRGVTVIGNMAGRDVVQGSYRRTYQLSGDVYGGRSFGGCLPALAGITVLAVAMYFVIRAVVGLPTDTGWSMPWPEIGSAAAVLMGLVALVMAVRAGVRWRRRRRIQRS